MTENQNEPVEPESVPEPEAEAVSEAVSEVEPEVLPEVVPGSGPAVDGSAVPAEQAGKPVRRARGRGRVLAIAGSVLLVGAVVSGVGYTVVTVDGADRDAGAPVWDFPKATTDEKRPADAEGLAGMLVPYGTHYWNRGPDIAEYGSDVALSGAEATALRKKSLTGLPRTQRRQLEKQIDRQATTGMVMRSYVSTYGSTGSGVSSVEITLTQMERRAAAKDIVTSQNAFIDALDLFRKGPEVKGFKNAKCFLLPKDADLALDAMYCSAYQGDILISATAFGVKPLPTEEIVTLLAEQLDRIAEPGEAV
ncbi:hypothetical protein ACIPSE_36345 [Streptomyces sp. NPDC090106]|uniref:hypothetical protein n=1 Tax=Streptomyces sp. NPDC090106 TaxID=3365946 RepID=UPI003801FF2F